MVGAEYNKMVTKKNLTIILIVLIVSIIIGIQEPAQKQAVADIEGQACSVDSDCPCWGELESGVEAFGIGTASCNENTLTCDTTFCVDAQPVAEFVRDNPWQWLRTNPLILFALIGLIVLILYWPKLKKK